MNNAQTSTDEKCVQNFGHKTCREGISWKTGKEGCKIQENVYLMEERGGCGTILRARLVAFQDLSMTYSVTNIRTGQIK